VKKGDKEVEDGATAPEDKEEAESVGNEMVEDGS
jgi:hypothetical protein